MFVPGDEETMGYVKNGKIYKNSEKIFGNRKKFLTLQHGCDIICNVAVM